MAYFSAFELKAYVRAQWVPEGEVLDLGCREGTFAEMLKLTKPFEGQLIGADIDFAHLKQAAQKRELYQRVVRLDASQIPFKDETFDSVISNGVFFGLKPDPLRASREVCRVLKLGGTFACTVPTNTANQHYFLAESLDALRLTGLGRWYRRRIDTRMRNVSMLTRENWVSILCSAGLSVQKIIPYISAAISRRWSMYLEIPRVLSLLKCFKSERVRSSCAAILRRQMARSYQRQVMAPFEEQGDYLLIICRKPPR